MGIFYHSEKEQKGKIMMKKTIKKSFAVLLVLLTVVCIMPISSRAVTTDIPSDAIELNGHYYYAFDEGKTWTEAKEKCEVIGGHLVTISTQEEQEIVESIIKNGTKSCYWLGGTDEIAEGQWKWITGEEFKYTHWAKDMPDNFLTENYLMMFKEPHPRRAGNTFGLWNDLKEDCTCKDTPFFRKDGFGFICEWEKKTVPTGYNFLRDSYNFGNYIAFISKTYFEKMFYDTKGWELFSLCMQEAFQGGMCFGMATTTAAIYNGLPDVSAFAYRDGLEVKTAEKIRDLNKKSLTNPGAITIVGGVYDGDLTLDDYIKYAHIFQLSSMSQKARVETTGKELYNIVKNDLENNAIGTVVEMFNDGSAHAVLAVGIDGNSILVDDPNSTNALKKITVNDDGTWSFMKNWDSTHCQLKYESDYNIPLLWIENKISKKTKTQSTEEAIAEYFDYDNLLLTVNSQTYNLENNSAIKIEGVSYSENNDSEEKNINIPNLYWISKDDTVTINEIKDCNNEFRLAGNKNIIYVNTDEANSVTLKMNDENNESAAVISTDPGKKCSVACVLFDKGNTYDIKATGTSNSDTVTAAIIENGIKVTGLNDIEVSYVKNEEKVEDGDTIAEVKDGREVNITVDESKDTVKTDFVGEQTESVCGYCGKVHGTSFKEVLIKFFHRIFYFFVKLFGLKK